MNHSYGDITVRLGLPAWWDEHGVPRYCDFEPQAVSNIYARQAVLLEIACQSCGARFRVCLTIGPLDERVNDVGELHYGDPPNTSCCPAGPTMSSVPLRVLEFWQRNAGDWTRRADLEKSIDCEWA